MVRLLLWIFVVCAAVTVFLVWAGVQAILMLFAVLWGVVRGVRTPRRRVTVPQARWSNRR